MAVAVSARIGTVGKCSSGADSWRSLGHCHSGRSWVPAACGTSPSHCPPAARECAAAPQWRHILKICPQNHAPAASGTRGRCLVLHCTALVKANCCAGVLVGVLLPEHPDSRALMNHAQKGVSDSHPDIQPAVSSQSTFVTFAGGVGVGGCFLCKPHRSILGIASRRFLGRPGVGFFGLSGPFWGFLGIPGASWVLRAVPGRPGA